MKLELRCHAVLCKTEAKAKAMAVQLHEKISFALREFMREKTRKQNSRLTLQRTNSLPLSGSIVPQRTKLLSTGHNFKPPISKSNTAPKLGSIHEDSEIEEDIEEEEVDAGIEEEFSETVEALTLLDHGHVNSELDGLCDNIIDIEIGNDIEELKMEGDVQFCISNGGDSDEESSESGFHEPDSKDGSLNAPDETSLDGEDVVCDLPSGLVEEESQVTSF